MSESATETPARPQPAWMTLEGFRCRTCQRLLLKISPQALKSGSALEIKCACKTMNYLMGS